MFYNRKLIEINDKLSELVNSRENKEKAIFQYLKSKNNKMKQFNR